MIKEGFTISDETINQFLQADFTPSIWEMVTYDSFLQKKSTIYQELISNTSNESSIKNQSSTLEEIFGEIEKQFIDKKSAQDAYEKMSQELNQLIDQEIITVQEEININSNRLKFYLNYQNQIQLLQQFAKKEIYEIPYQIENEWVNVSVVHKVSNEDTKNLSIDLTTKQFGSVHIGMDVLDHKISGFFTCEQNAISLELKRNKFLDVIKEQGYEITELPVVQTKEKIMISNELNSNNDQIVEEKPNSDLLYFITKEILALF